MVFVKLLKWLKKYKKYIVEINWIMFDRKYKVRIFNEYLF